MTSYIVVSLSQISVVAYMFHFDHVGKSWGKYPIITASGALVVTSATPAKLKFHCIKIGLTWQNQKSFFYKPGLKKYSATIEYSRSVAPAPVESNWIVET